MQFDRLVLQDCPDIDIPVKFFYTWNDTFIVGFSWYLSIYIYPSSPSKAWRRYDSLVHFPLKPVRPMLSTPYTGAYTTNHLIISQYSEIDDSNKSIDSQATKEQGLS